MKSIRYFSLCMVVFTLTVLSLFDACRKSLSVDVPIVSTNSITNVTSTSAVCGGNVTSDGGSAVKSRGVCWSTSHSSTINSSKTIDSTGTGKYTSTVSGLSSNTTYYIRAYATNSSGTGYGEERSFKTQSGGGTVTDYDGNVYHVIILGTQDWLVENLNVTHYSNGDAIPIVTSGTVWSSLNSGAYCNYKNSLTSDTLGHLYNWYAVNDSRKVCPEGWHIPTDDEWKTLLYYLGGPEIAGGKMKSTGTLEQGDGLWHEPNTGATNESGFTALPGGYRDGSGNFSQLSNSAYFWSSTEKNPSNAWDRELSYKYGNVDRYDNLKTNGFSVRCLKNK